jgi:hypothetical protein
MIFRAPAGHHLLSKPELEKVLSLLESNQIKEASEYISFCIKEVSFYDEIRRLSEEKKMYKEDGNIAMANILEHDMRTHVKRRVELSRLMKDNFINL